MANNKNHSISLFLVGPIFLSIICGIQANDSYNDLKVRNLFPSNKFDISSAINGILSQNWTQNQECLIELNAIKKGINNHEEWAIKRT